MLRVNYRAIERSQTRNLRSRGYSREVRGVLASVVAAVALVGCAATAASIRPRPIVFGVGGGNMVPWQVTIQPDGRIRHEGLTVPKRHRVSRAEFLSLSRLVRRDFAGGLANRLCPKINPDVGSSFIRDFGRTVTVHGNCEARFNRLWGALMRAVGLNPG